ncbi:hypothetical protein F5Y19DRAFT_381388 [Xylariaceae sp. FL1651]|nr:hypothetical protein F5Y19DRAFT_381388 [Xylariaceae sp. FL1651]
MTTTVTEVVQMTLVPNADNSIIAESTKIMAEQKGCLAVRSFRWLEDPSRLEYFIDWDSIESHINFARNEEVYLPFRARIGSVMAAYNQPFHVPLPPYPPALLESQDGAGKSSVKAVGQAWFAGGVGFPSERMESVSAAFQGFVDAVRGEQPVGFSGKVAAGWAKETIVRKAEVFRLFFFVMGWDSVEAHTRYRDSDHYKQAISAITNLEDFNELEFHHVGAADVSS